MIRVLTINRVPILERQPGFTNPVSPTQHGFLQRLTARTVQATQALKMTTSLVMIPYRPTSIPSNTQKSNLNSKFGTSDFKCCYRRESGYIENDSLTAYSNFCYWKTATRYQHGIYIVLRCVHHDAIAPCGIYRSMNSR